MMSWFACCNNRIVAPPPPTARGSKNPLEKTPKSPKRSPRSPRSGKRSQKRSSKKRGSSPKRRGAPEIPDASVLADIHRPTQSVTRISRRNPSRKAVTTPTTSPNSSILNTNNKGEKKTSKKMQGKFSDLKYSQDKNKTIVIESDSEDDNENATLASPWGSSDGKFSRVISPKRGKRKNMTKQERNVLRSRVRKKLTPLQILMFQNRLGFWEGPVQKKSTTKGWKDLYFYLRRHDLDGVASLYVSSTKEEMKHALQSDGTLKLSSEVSLVEGVSGYECNPTDFEELILTQVKKGGKKKRSYYRFLDTDDKEGAKSRDEFAERLQNYLDFFDRLK